VGGNIIAIVLVLLVVSVVVLSFRIDRIPRRLQVLFHDERSRGENLARAVLTEAAAQKIGPLLAGMRSAHDQTVASLRAQLAEAETRARVSERRASDAVIYLEAASTLVSALRALHDESKALRRGESPALGTRVETEALDLDQRTTVEIRRGSTESPRSAEVAMIAARLTNRPRQEAMSPSSFAPEESDSGVWPAPERPSDAEGERTRVGLRPSPESLGLTGAQRSPTRSGVLVPTLLSMPVVQAQASRVNPTVEIAEPERGC
jgi:hypothetical protein